MGKRYFCDFCEKSFADNPTNRKNHLKGVNHQRMRKLHYSYFKDPSSMLAEESMKKPCRTLMTHGECPFGEGCKYSHLTPDRKKQLEDQILKEKMESLMKKKKLEANPPSLEDWLTKRSSKSKKPQSNETESKKKIEQLLFSLPPSLSNVSNIPPSLLPPPPHAWYGLTQDEEWG